MKTFRVKKLGGSGYAVMAARRHGLTYVEFAVYEIYGWNIAGEQTNKQRATAYARELNNAAKKAGLR
jgi:hypothetical protein